MVRLHINPKPASHFYMTCKSKQKYPAACWVFLNSAGIGSGDAWCCQTVPEAAVWGFSSGTRCFLHKLSNSRTAGWHSTTVSWLQILFQGYSRTLSSALLLAAIIKISAAGERLFSNLEIPVLPAIYSFLHIFTTALINIFDKSIYNVRGIARNDEPTEKYHLTLQLPSVLQSFIMSFSSWFSLFCPELLFWFTLTVPMASFSLRKLWKPTVHYLLSAKLQADS